MADYEELLKRGLNALADDHPTHGKEEVMEQVRNAHRRRKTFVVGATAVLAAVVAVGSLAVANHIVRLDTPNVPTLEASQVAEQPTPTPTPSPTPTLDPVWNPEYAEQGMFLEKFRSDPELEQYRFATEGGWKCEVSLAVYELEENTTHFKPKTVSKGTWVADVGDESVHLLMTCQFPKSLIPEGEKPTMWGEIPYECGKEYVWYPNAAVQPGPGVAGYNIGACFEEVPDFFDDPLSEFEELKPGESLDLKIEYYADGALYEETHDHSHTYLDVEGGVPSVDEEGNVTAGGVRTCERKEYEEAIEKEPLSMMYSAGFCHS
ncbi:MAG: hypothetical protein LBR21_10715 [Propionibacteriaceae bacterium]|jgi:hypothetical protein|nr:hypothetical protein [Propionibacteriaceae bacterium]